MTIKCEFSNCNYPDCTCAPCLNVEVLVPSRGDSIKNVAVKLNFRGGTAKQAMLYVRAAIKALQAEFDAGIKHHGEEKVE